jgi:hypothetical protein
MILPISTLFIIVAVTALLTQYSLNQALKLGVLAGFLAALVINIFITLVLLMKRKVHEAHQLHTHPEMGIKHTSTTGPINKSFILLIDKAMAFDIAMQAIIEQKIGEVSKGSNKKKGILSLQNKEQSIQMKVDTLTPHTTEFTIKADNYSDTVKAIINYLKLKEQSLLNY